MLSSDFRDKGWKVRWLGQRNRLLSSPAFQRFAARFWLTRPIARRRATALFDLVAGFTYSQVLAACVESGLLEMLADGPCSTAQVATRLGLAPDGAERLLRAAAALGLAERVGREWMLGSQGAALRGNGGIAEMIAHHRLLYADLSDPLALLRKGGGGGALQAFWNYPARPGEGGEVTPYSALMAASQPLIADHVISAYPFARHRRLLDVGGGAGAFLAAVASRVPKLDLALFDLPAVGAIAGQRLGESVAIHGGSFLHDPLPTGFDLISLVRIIHDHDDAPALAILQAAYAALPTGGSLLIAEPMAGTRGAEAAGDAYFGMYLLAMGSGRPRRADELGVMLREAGFSRWREYRTALPLTVRVIAANK
jgi:demethylspheroidene O-methyltransferase